MTIEEKKGRELGIWQTSTSSLVPRYRYVISASVWIVCLLFVLYQSITQASVEPSRPCDAERIHKYFMNNLSVNHLLQTKPVQTDLFHYEVVNSKFCGSADLPIDLLIFITSKSSAFERRQAIRRTYGNLKNVFRHIHDSSNRLEVRVLFLLEFKETRWKTIQVEGDLFHDIVQVTLPEDYHLETYRDLAMLDWSATYCRQARFIFKMDESVFLNPFLLLKFINENKNDRVNLEPQLTLNIEQNCSTLDARLPRLYGFIQPYEDDVQNNKRFQQEQAAMSPTDFSCNRFPTYFNNHAYLISSDARDLILCVFYRQSSIPMSISNIYITGILAEFLSIERQSLLDYQLKSETQGSCEQFFRGARRLSALACITSNYSSSTLFEHYHVYWQLIVNAQLRSRDQ